MPFSRRQKTRLFSTLVCLLTRVQTHFVKDQATDAHQFPPVLDQRVKNLPPGHLRPFGYQRPPDGRVKAFKLSAGPELFLEKALQDRRPLLVRELYKPPAVKKWNDEYLSSQYGDITVVAHVRTNKNFTAKNMTMKRYLKTHRYEDMYVRMPMPEIVKKDLELPAYLTCPKLRYTLYGADLWMHLGMTATNVFYRSMDQFHCTVSGRADFVVAPAEKKDVFRMFETPYEHSGDGETKMDTEMVNMFENRKMTEVPWTWATLRERACIFLPQGTLQKVRTFGNYIGAVFSFLPIDNYGHCSEENIAHAVPLSSVETFTTYNNGTLTYGKAPWTERRLDEAFHFLMSDSELLYISKWADFYIHHAMPEDAKKKPLNFEDAWNVFKSLFDPDLRGFVTEDELDALTKEETNWLLKVLNGKVSHFKFDKPRRDEL